MSSMDIIAKLIMHISSFIHSFFHSTDNIEETEGHKISDKQTNRQYGE